MTTEGILWGHPQDKDTKQVLRELDDAHVAFLFNADKTRPRPCFSLVGSNDDLIGREEIACWIAERANTPESLTVMLAFDENPYVAGAALSRLSSDIAKPAQT